MPYTNNSWKSDLFSGKVVLVTGGAGTICRQQTEALIQLGANAAIIGRNVSKTENAAKEMSSIRPGAKVIGLGGVDVRNVNDLVKAVERTVQELGKVDLVICGAAGNFLADVNHLSSNAFKTVVDIDLLGSYNTIKACYEQLVKNKGSVIFVSATLHYYGLPFQAHVSAAKAGIDALNQVLAVELGPVGVRFNVIAPGAIGGTEGFDRLNRESIDAIKARIPLQRLGTTSDIADATVFLFSPAGDYITGTITVVDGGLWHTGNGGFNSKYPEDVKKLALAKPKL
ncbi:unnamed protein product [Kuraishia capsulata CBS 1993]|uniref:2,4-dienoyl-CoA reductase [(3E)-enoyl-CoA-producing] n=1 Tax=Kuraishia capsulata CBS 1993 TaxID=1382522 RepID=W6MFZ6_9ASCO|nr:uncharacterized protein KUCA_T00000562001 [Kuraishia capsulata CBS 1993]CDK24596.1 unnamed protein product [Kuraishia capsulata CBS 1993]